MSQFTRPPMKPSDEATPEQLQLARAQGDAIGQALMHMTRKEAHGEERPAGDYLVGYAVEHAEGMYVMQGGELTWRNPEQENAHIEISVRDGADGRFVPGLTVRVTVLAADGREVGTNIHPFLWHPWLYHYGRNWTVPGDGEYRLRVLIEAPDFPRHDKENGKRYARAVEVEFPSVHIKTGRKMS